MHNVECLECMHGGYRFKVLSIKEFPGKVVTTSMAVCMSCGRPMFFPDGDKLLVEGHTIIGPDFESFFGGGGEHV